MLNDGSCMASLVQGLSCSCRQPTTNPMPCALAARQVLWVGSAGCCLCLLARLFLVW